MCCVKISAQCLFAHAGAGCDVTGEDSENTSGVGVKAPVEFLSGEPFIFRGKIEKRPRPAATTETANGQKHDVEECTVTTTTISLLESATRTGFGHNGWGIRSIESSSRRYLRHCAPVVATSCDEQSATAIDAFIIADIHIDSLSASRMRTLKVAPSHKLSVAAGTATMPLV